MSNNKLLVNERQRDLGNFMVGRLLPFREKRQVGPFTFIDHMGPTKLSGGNYFDVDQHPHIGLSTLTYLFEGSIEHKDSIGSKQLIKPGDVGFMTAGKGVTHTERTPTNLRKGEELIMHGYQVWVALPKELEEIEPHFQYIPSSDLPSLEVNGVKIKVIAGTAFEKTSPLKAHSELFMVDIFSEEDTDLDLSMGIQGEVAFVIVKGKITEGNETANAGQMLISKTKEACKIHLEKGTQLLLFGGKPLPEERYLSWNFVSSSRERLKKARNDWENHLFSKIEDDDTYIPFPPAIR